MRLVQSFILASVLLLGMATSAHANKNTFGVGVSYVFGEGFAVGPRWFLDNDESKPTCSLGVDYLLKSKSWRSNIGHAYIGGNTYGVISVGYNHKAETFDFGVGAGFADTEMD